MSISKRATIAVVAWLASPLPGVGAQAAPPAGTPPPATAAAEGAGAGAPRRGPRPYAQVITARALQR
ncbi:MAG: hypothetical protein ACOVSI_10010, partial [Gemmatimonas sp.]